MEKMDQTRTDCNLTRRGFPGETPRFCRRDMSISLRFFLDAIASEKTPHHLFSGILDCHGHGGHSAQHDGGLGKLKGGPKVFQDIDPQ